MGLDPPGALHTRACAAAQQDPCPRRNIHVPVFARISRQDALARSHDDRPVATALVTVVLRSTGTAWSMLRMPDRPGSRDQGITRWPDRRMRTPTAVPWESSRYAPHQRGTAVLVQERAAKHLVIAARDEKRQVDAWARCARDARSDDGAALVTSIPSRTSSPRTLVCSHSGPRCRSLPRSGNRPAVALRGRSSAPRRVPRSIADRISSATRARSVCKLWTWKYWYFWYSFVLDTAARAR